MKKSWGHKWQPNHSQVNLVNDVSNNQLECSTATTPIQNSTTRIENRAHVITEPEIAVDISTTESPMISKIQMSTPGIENRAKDTNAESNLFIERGTAANLSVTEPLRISIVQAEPGVECNNASQTVRIVEHQTMSLSVTVSIESVVDQEVQMNSEPSTLNGSPDPLIGEGTSTLETNEVSSRQLTSSTAESIPTTRVAITQSESTVGSTEGSAQPCADLYPKSTDD